VIKDDHKSIKESYTKIITDIAKLLYLIDFQRDLLWDLCHELQDAEMYEVDILTSKEKLEILDRLDKEICTNPDEYSNQLETNWNEYINSKDHVGDCCCIPITCLKCEAQKYVFRAEELLLKNI